MTRSIDTHLGLNDIAVHCIFLKKRLGIDWLKLE